MPQLPPGSPFEELFKEFFDKKDGEQQQRRGTSLGSGFIIDGDGYIVTNNHVIQGAEDITVILRDDTQLKAKLVGSRQPGRPRACSRSSRRTRSRCRPSSSATATRPASATG